MPKISILISVYNMEQMIHDALDSAINQTMKDIEIVVVDNCSSDSTREVVKHYQKLDSRIRLIALETNTGLLNSHIVGGREALGEYLVYLDSDDYLDLNFCKKMYHTITTKNVDMVQCQIAVHIYENCIRKSIPDVYGNYFKNGTLLRGKEVMEARLQRQLMTPLWGKIFKKEFYLNALDMLNLPENINLTFAEDTIQSYPMYYLCQSHYSLGDKLYHYAVVENSESRRIDKAFSTLQQIGQFISLARDFFNKYRFDELYSEEVLHNEKHHMTDLILQFLPYLSSDEVKKSPIVKMIQDSDILSFIEQFSQRRILQLDQKVLNFVYPNKTPHFSKKQIAFYINRMYNGGVERCLAKKIHLLVSLDYEIILFTVEDLQDNDYNYPKNITRIILGKDYQTHFSQLYQYIQEYQIEILELCDYFCDIMFNVALLGKLMGITTIFAYHANLDTIITNPMLIIDVTNLGKIVDIVTCLSRVDMLSWKMYGIKNVVYIPNFLTFDDKPHALKEPNKNIVFVARIDPFKGIFDLVNAMSIVAQAIPDVKLTIVGGPSYLNDNTQEKALHNTVERLKLSNHIACVGFQKDVTPYLEEASIFCCPTHADSWNMSYAEAKSYGLATVVSDLPNLELFDSSDSIQFEVGNITDLAYQLIYLLKNPDLIKSMGKSAIENIKPFNNQHVMRQYCELLNSIETGQLDIYISKKYHDQIQINMDTLMQNLGQQRLKVMQLQISHIYTGGVNIFDHPKLRPIKAIAAIFCPPNTRRRVWVKKIFVCLLNIYRDLKSLIRG